jgi:hypothetical protein
MKFANQGLIHAPKGSGRTSAPVKEAEPLLVQVIKENASELRTSSDSSHLPYENRRTESLA